MSINNEKNPTMLKTLMKKQFVMLNSGFFIDRKSGAARTRKAVIGYILVYLILVCGSVGFMMGYIAYSICKPLCMVGMNWLYMVMMALMSMALGIFGSVFNTYSSLYQAKDNDLMLSLPIPIRYLLLTRLTGVYAMGALFSALVMIPAIIVYGVVIRPGAGEIIASLWVFLLVTFVVLVLSCILGWILGKVGKKTKNKSFVTVIMSLVFLAAYFWVYSNANKLLTSIVANGAAYGAKVKGAAYPLYSIGRAATGSIGHIVVVTAGTVVLVVLVWIILEKSFLGIATDKGSQTRKAYVERRVKQKSVSQTLLRREFKRLSSSAIYMLNCSLGTVMMMVGAVVFLIKGSTFVPALYSALGINGEGANGGAAINSSLILFIACMAVCGMAAMNDITAPSISLEGKTLWIVRTMPVSSWSILAAKQKMHVILTAIPATLFNIIIMCFVKPDVVNGIFMLILPVVFVFMTGYLGLVVNLKMPNIQWTSEAAVVKQSMGVLVALFGAIAYIIVMIAVYVAAYKMISVTLYLAICVAVTGIIDILLRIWLKKTGVKLFEAL